MSSRPGLLRQDSVVAPKRKGALHLDRIASLARSMTGLGVSSQALTAEQLEERRQKVPYAERWVFFCCAILVCV